MGKRIQSTRAKVGFKSSLAEPGDRFLSTAIEYLLSNGLRSPAQFVAFFPPMAIARALTHAPRLRARILEVTAGLSREAAAECSPTEAGEILDQAFDDGDASPEILLCLLEPDARVRYLNRYDLWSFVAEHGAWATHLTHDARRRQVSRCIAYLLHRALAEGLVSRQRIASILGAQRLVERLPRKLVARLMERVLARGRRNQAPYEGHFVEMLSWETLLRYFEPSILLEEILLPELTAVFRAPARTSEAGAVATFIDGISLGPIAVEPVPRERRVDQRAPLM